MRQLPAAIEIRNATVVYNQGTPNEVLALDDITLSLDRGKTIILTGENGSGKSTLIKAIAGTVPLTSGNIFINGTEVTNWPAYKRAKVIGFVHQDPMLGTCPNLTVHENFQLSMTKPWWLPMPYRLSLTEGQVKAIERTGLPLGRKKATPVSMLSGGQRQAIALCLALSTNHSILLLDEFTSSLDEKTEDAVLSFALNEADRLEATVLMIMHDMDRAKGLKFRKIRMISGKLVAD